MIDADRLRPAVHQLLRHPLAPTPPLAELHRRARRIRARRRVGIGAGLAALLALSLVLPLRLLDTSGATTVRTVTPVDAPPVTAAPAPNAPGDAGDGAAPPVSAAPSGRPAAPSPEPRDEPRQAAAPEDDVWSPEHRQDEAEGCQVWSDPGPGTTVGPGGVGSGPDRGPRSCSYRATRSGGYEGSGTWSIEIVRGEERIHIDSLDAPPCADDVVRPGDLVRVELGSSTAPLSASAGSRRWHLSIGTFAGCR